MRTPGPIRTTLASLLAALVAAGCSDSTAPPPPPRPEPELNILQLAPTAPPLVSTSVTFPACKGGPRAEGRLAFAGQDEDFARLRIESNSLLTKPDGTPFANGECIDITMAVDDPTKVLVRLEPSGLKFNPSAPAELKLEYDEAAGVTPVIEQQLAIWVQENPGDPFTQLGSLRIENLKEVEAQLQGFSRFALAY